MMDVNYEERLRFRMRGELRKCVEFGEFKLHSGGFTDWRCELIKARTVFHLFMQLLKPKRPTVGIERCGMLLASVYEDYGVVLKGGDGKLSRLYLPVLFHEGISLVDDVVTTASSFQEAEELLSEAGVVVYERLAVLDRRVDKNWPVRALFTDKYLFDYV